MYLSSVETIYVRVELVLVFICWLMFDTADCFSILLLEPSENKLEDNPYPRRSSAPVQEESPIPAGKRSPSPAKNPPCKTLHVKNLVRPFTLNQLKDLLGKHGTLVQDGFWIDRIKSHCYVVVRKNSTCN